jgi:uracil-DNA glycosylase
MTPRKSSESPCWRGANDSTPFIAGVPASVPRSRSLKHLFAAMACCTRCELAVGRTQVVIGVGAAKAHLMFVGEAPGEKEDLAGRPFVGSAGKLLDKLLEGAGIPRDDVFITNIVACRPPGNRTPKVKEVKAHAPWLEEQLRLVKPQVVVTLGRVALTYFVPKAKVTAIRGQPQELERDGRTILLLPTFHPAAVLRDYKVMYPKIEADFRKIARLLNG